ncbi:MAG: hypothetical protein AB7G37_20020 [Solirubrobacteraceae bacterium]
MTQIPVEWPDGTKMALAYLREQYPIAYPDDDPQPTFHRSRPATSSPSGIVTLVAVPQGRVTLISRTMSLVMTAQVVDEDGLDDVDAAYALGARVLKLLHAWPSAAAQVVRVADGTGPTPAREAGESQREFQELTAQVEVQR